MWLVASVSDVKDFIDQMIGRRVVGMLFYRPQTPTGRTIFDSRNYWNVRSGPYLDLLCVGYGHDQSGFTRIDDPTFRQLSPDGPQYSDAAFNAIRAWTEFKLDWSYSGDADLLLIETNRTSADQVTTLQSYVSLQLTGLTPRFGVNAVLEKICRYAEAGPDNLLNRLSDGGAIGALIGEVTRRFPGIDQALDFRVRQARDPSLR